MRWWLILLFIPLAGCLGSDEVVMCVGPEPAGAGGHATYAVADPTHHAGFRTLTIRPATDAWLGGDDYNNDWPTALLTPEIHIAIEPSEAGNDITYRNATDAKPFAVEHLDTEGVLVATSLWPDGVHWRRLDHGGLPHLFGAAWAWGLTDERTWTATARAHTFEPATSAEMRFDVAWTADGCGGRLEIGPGMIDGDAQIGFGGWALAFDGSPWPSQIDVLDDGDVATTWIRTASDAGAGHIPSRVAPPARPLATVDEATLRREVPDGFVTSIQEAIDAIALDPQGALFLQQNPDAGLLAYLHGPLDDGDFWYLEMVQSGGKQKLNAIVKTAASEGRDVRTADVETNSVSGYEPMQPPFTSMEAIASWHAEHGEGHMDTLGCGVIPLIPCVFGTAEEAALDVASGLFPTAFSASGLTAGYRVGTHNGVVSDFKEA